MTKIEAALGLILIGYAIGVTIISLATRGGSQGAVVVVPDQVVTRGSSARQMFFTILGIVVFLLSLSMCSHLT